MPSLSNPLQSNQFNPNALENNPLSAQQFSQYQKETEQSTSRLLSNEKKLQNNIFSQMNNDVLKQSEINHIFDWKLSKEKEFLGQRDLLMGSLSTQKTSVPKYKLDNSTLER